MAVKSRSRVLFVVEQPTPGVLKWPTAATQATVLREGITFEGAVETVDSDELVDDIGASEGFVTKEAPVMSVPKYLKPSGVEGQAPDFGIMIESCLGSQTAIATERSTTSGSTAGSSSARAVVKLAAGGSDYAKGRAVLLKDGANGYSIRNVWDLSSNDLTLNFNLAAAPASGVACGKAVHYAPAAEGHKIYSGHLHQSSASSAFHKAISDLRTIGMQMEFAANQLATVNFDAAGIQFYFNPIEITATTKYIDFNIGGSELTAELTEKSYKSPIELAREATTKMTAAAGSAVTASYDSSTGKYSFSKASGTLELLWNTGTNAANTAGGKFGYATAADDTGATTYVADNALTYDPAFTPDFDDSSPAVVKHNEFVFGTFDRYLTRNVQRVGITWDTPKQDLDDASAETGVSESVTSERSVVMTADIYVKQHEVADFDAFINNSTISSMFNHGPKSGGNWVPGKCVNVCMPNGKLTAHLLSDADGVLLYAVEIRGFVSPSQKDGHINFV